MEGEEKYKEEPMRGRLSLVDLKTSKDPIEKREMVIDTIASISRDDEEAMKVSMGAAAYCHLWVNRGPDYEKPEFDQWLPMAMKDFEIIARKCYGISE